MAFVIKFEDAEYNTDDLTGLEARWIEQKSQRAFGLLHPGLRADDLLWVLAAFLKREQVEAEVLKLIEGVKVAPLMNAVTVPKDDDLPDEWEDGIPLAEGDQPTDTRSSSPEPSTGPQTSPTASRSETSTS